MEANSRGAQEWSARDDQTLFAAGSFWQGQYPHPDDVARYEEFAPGFLDRTVSMAEDAARTRNAAIRRTVRASTLVALRGQAMAFVLAGAALALAAVSVFVFGNTTAAALFLSLPVVLLVRSFLGQSGGSEEENGLPPSVESDRPELPPGNDPNQS